ncbi:Furin [Actinoplanes sp. SE50]|uniref:S8 family serine peptidase n=1 Tax=unclassified Actinoplanes TaxID=2626549 RepID=UPI00023EC405|nr:MULTISPECIES: S8 family serine peptidase [unclassified Actinoplanes]AEV82494.1 Furin [Actinoplanes sp. SE50/110]ATO80891.1 Furin [Actinoplanes sp. SE50]SLL98298.1 furin [Actinoplanes sp. SE50/110]
MALLRGLPAVFLLLIAVVVTPAAAMAADCARPARLTGSTAWPRTMLSIDSATSFSRGGGVVVAVLSTGVRAGQRQLAGRVLAGRDAVRNQGAADTDCTGIGTQVAGVIAADRADGSPVLGLAGKATILPVRVTGDDGTVQPAALSRGISFAVQAGADVIVVAEPAYQDSAALRDAVAAAVAADVPVIAAAGDLGAAQDANPTPFPATYPGVIGVGAIDQNGAIFPKSQHGPYVDLVAPGVAVPTLQGGDGASAGLVEADGTALAAGYVGATAALVRARFGRLPVAEVTRQLTASASPTVTGDAFGAGVVNPSAAVTGRVSDRRPRALPALSPAAAGRSGVENRRRAAAFTGATIAGVAVLAVLMVTAAIRRSRRQHWRPALAPPPPSYAEPIEPGPPVMLLDQPDR